MKIFEVSNSNQKTFGDGVKKYAKKKGITLQLIADAIGISRSHLSNILSGRSKMYYDTMTGICQVLDIDQLVIFMDLGDFDESNFIRY